MSEELYLYSFNEDGERAQRSIRARRGGISLRRSTPLGRCGISRYTLRVIRVNRTSSTRLCVA